MSTDDDLSRALQLGCALAIARVTSVAEDKAGTRSATAVYHADVERLVEGALPTPVVLKHFGAPCLEADQLCTIAAQDTHRHHGAWELRFAAPAATPDINQVEQDFRARVARLR